MTAAFFLTSAFLDFFEDDDVEDDDVASDVNALRFLLDVCELLLVLLLLVGGKNFLISTQYSSNVSATTSA